MGVAAVSGGGGPPGGDFGALFGARGGGANGQTELKWEAPGLGGGQSPSPPSSALSNLRLEFWEWAAQGDETFEPPDIEAEVVKKNIDPVRESQDAFTKLLRASKSHKSRNLDDLNLFCDFLASDADEPAAQNTKRLVQWLTGRCLNVTEFQQVVTLINDKLKLQTLSQSELVDVLELLHRTVDWRRSEAAALCLRGAYETFCQTLKDTPTESTPVCFALVKVLRLLASGTNTVRLLMDVLDRAIAGAPANAGHDILLGNLPTILIEVASRDLTEKSRSEKIGQVVQMLSRVKFKPNTLGRCTRQYLDKIEDHTVRVETTRLWLRCLRECRYEGKAFHDVYAELAKHFRPVELAEHFGSMPPLDFARALLRAWLPNVDINKFVEENWDYDQQDLEERSPIDQTEFSMKTLPALAEDFEELFTGTVIAEYGENDYPIKCLLLASTRKGAQTDALAETILDVYKAARPLKKLHNLFSRLYDTPELYLKPSAIASIATHFLASDHPARAIAILNAVPSLSPERFPDIYLRLVRFGLLDTRQVFRFLLRNRERVPFHARSDPRLALTPAHVDAVHLFAYELATQATPRKALRAVWWCYRYLRDRGAPMSPLLSRSLVRAGILRPLAAHIWIPDERLRFIVRAVALIEGEAMAGQVDQVAWRARVGVHDEVMRKRRIAWASGAAVLQKHAAFRLKMWTKRRPVPVEGGEGGFVVPERVEAVERSEGRREVGAVSAASGIHGRGTKGQVDGTERSERLRGIPRGWSEARESSRAEARAPERESLAIPASNDGIYRPFCSGDPND